MLSVRSGLMGRKLVSPCVQSGIGCSAAGTWLLRTGLAPSGRAVLALHSPFSCFTKAYNIQTKEKAKQGRQGFSTPALCLLGAIASAGSQQLATAMGYAVLAGASVRSIPQILRMQKNKSAQGVSLTSNIAELIAYTINVAYNMQLGYPFSSYGEVVACWLQDIVIVALIVRFNVLRGWRTWASTAAFGVFFWAVMTGVCGKQALYGLQASTVGIISLGGRVPQIWMNHKRGNSGELSIATCALNLAGNAIRVYTTLVLTKDTLIMAGTALGVVLNSILLMQTLHTARGDLQDEQGALRPQPT